jgi:hypothetical protein
MSLLSSGRRSKAAVRLKSPTVRALWRCFGTYRLVERGDIVLLAEYL